MDEATATQRRTGSSRKVAKSNDRRRDYQNANRPRNRSQSTADLFDNSKAPRQLEGEDEGRASEVANEGERQVTSHDTSVVNGPLGERASPRRHGKQKEQRADDSPGWSERPPEDSQEFAWWSENASRAETSSPIPGSVFLDSTQTCGKIEAYIDAVYERAMRERAKTVSEKHEEDGRSEDSSQRDLGASRDGSAESSRRNIDRGISNVRSSSNGESNTNEPREPIAKSGSEQKGVYSIDEENRRYLEL